MPLITPATPATRCAVVAISGLVGLRPNPATVADVTSPPYDVIKPGSALEAKLAGSPTSLYHVILGNDPRAALDQLVERGALQEDLEPAFYVYEQRFEGAVRTGVLLAAEVSPYAEGQVIRHEKTFDDKVSGRIALRSATDHTFGPVFTLTKAPLSAALAPVYSEAPAYAFETDLGGLTDLHGIQNRIWRVPAESPNGKAIQAALAPEPLYIADGHHRYHASLRNEQTHFLCYVTEEAKILAYNRVLRGRKTFESVKSQFNCAEVSELRTPPKNHFCIYTKSGCWEVPFSHVPTDVVGRLDCAILEKELYAALELNHSDIADPARFDYYSESDLKTMREVVDRGEYDAAVALHPVALEELMAVADAGLTDSNTVMPEKSTFFSPKILTGMFIYRHVRRA